jgi:acetyl-CoA acyltransferase 2
MECSLWSALTDWHARIPMAITAENLAVKYNISREDCDKFALLSQKRWSDANKSGKFKDEVVPVTIKVKGKELSFEVDEHPKPDTTMETLAKLPTAFKKDGVVTAGNASGVNDGAAALVLASEDAVEKHSLSPLARVVGYCSMGVDPTIMGKPSLIIPHNVHIMPIQLSSFSFCRNWSRSRHSQVMRPKWAFFK